MWEMYLFEYSSWHLMLARFPQWSKVDCIVCKFWNFIRTVKILCWKKRNMTHTVSALFSLPSTQQVQCSVLNSCVTDFDSGLVWPCLLRPHLGHVCLKNANLLIEDAKYLGNQRQPFPFRATLSGQVRMSSKLWLVAQEESRSHTVSVVCAFGSPNIEATQYSWVRCFVRQLWLWGSVHIACVALHHLPRQVRCHRIAGDEAGQLISVWRSSAQRIRCGQDLKAGQNSRDLVSLPKLWFTHVTSFSSGFRRCLRVRSWTGKQISCHFRYNVWYS